MEKRQDQDGEKAGPKMEREEAYKEAGPMNDAENKGQRWRLV